MIEVSSLNMAVDPSGFKICVFTSVRTLGAVIVNSVWPCWLKKKSPVPPSLFMTAMIGNATPESSLPRYWVLVIISLFRDQF